MCRLIVLDALQVADFFARLVQRVSPKSYSQAMAEVTVSQRFFENFSGDQVWRDSVLQEPPWLQAPPTSASEGSAPPGKGLQWRCSSQA